MPSETTVSRESRHDSKQMYNSERNQSGRDTRASTSFSGVVSTAVPHVPDVRTITRFNKCSINKSQTKRKKNRSIQTSHEQNGRVRVHTWARGRERSFEGTNRRKECVPDALLSHRVQQTRLDVHCVRTLQMTMPTTHLGMVIVQTSGDPCPMARVPSKQATHAPRTETREFKMESQRQESKTTNHLKSRTKTPDTRPNLNHWNDKNREPRTTENRKHNDRTRNPTPDTNRQL